MDRDMVNQRMIELMQPVDQQIMMCDDRQDLLMFACAMLQRVNEILDTEIGVEGRRLILEESIKFSKGEGDGND